jgi:hypothetical protein
MRRTPAASFEKYTGTLNAPEGSLAVHARDVMTLAVPLATETRMRANGVLAV